MQPAKRKTCSKDNARVCLGNILGIERDVQENVISLARSALAQKNSFFFALSLH